MKTLVAALIFLAFALPARAATQVTVAQLEQTLAAANTQPDAQLADQLAAIELTQRLSPSTLARLQSALPGPQSQQELSILAAQSSFLNLPPDELPATPAPDPADQRQIMAAVVAYVTQSTHKLPDFIATRDTRTFEDRPAGLYSYQPLHFTTQTSVNVVYRDGQERDTNSKGKKVDIAAQGLVSWGEFGPILTTVLLDAAKSQLAWSHWEQDADGQVAVFRYTVPVKNSHYQIQFCCVLDAAPGVDSAFGHAYQKSAPYHGEMAVDPSTGAIHRITVIADLDAGYPLITASIAVQYGAVDIGGKTYTCPIRSEAIAQRHVTQNREGTIPSTAITQGPILTRLNDVTFERYRLFRGDTRILTDAEAAQMTGQPAEPAPNSAPPPPESQPSAAESQPAAQPAQTTAESAPPAPAATAPASNPPPQPAVAASAPPPPAVVPQPAPDNPATTADIPVFRTIARQVLVDVVVDKKNGDPVANLPKSDFSVDEDGKPQSIDFFEEHSAAAPVSAAQPAMPPLPPGAVTNVPTAAPSAALYVFLLDALNTEPQDQVFIHQQVLSFLRKMDPGTQVAVFSLGSSLHILQGFTSDSAALLAAVSRKEPERDAMAQNRSDNADDAAHIAKLQSMRVSGATIEARQASDAAARGYSFGARASMTFEALNALARYLEGIPGRKNLVWFASSFPVSFFPTPTQMDQLKNNPNLPGYVNRVKQTANLFTLSKIAVYPVSGAGVMNSNIGTADSAGAGSAGGTGHFGTAANPTSSLTGESMGSANATANMEQLATSTGGRAFTTNDIDDALRKIVHDSAVYYTLGYAPPASTTDSAFRRIGVKVSGGKYKLAYRQGYNASSDASPQENPITPLLQLGLPAATGILYGVHSQPGDHPANPDQPAGQNPQLKGPLARYSVSFTIRAQDVSFGQASNGDHIAKLLIGLKAYGADGAALNWQATREALQLTPAQYESILQSGIPVTIDLDLPANTPAQLVTAVYDWSTTRSGTLEIPLHP
jgi:VWFA-related protein